jgi:beta-N-acetylhexosaminidase
MSPGADEDDGLTKIIGQMLIVGFQGTRPNESWPRQVVAQIESGKIGGVLIMDHNIQAPRKLAALTGAFRRAKAQLAPFIAIDQEGGPAPQLPPDKGFQRYASAAELGISNDPLNAYNIYQGMAVELAANGFNVNLGPVVDLAQAGENVAAAVNQDRYGSQPKHVAAFAKAFRLAHRNEGLLTVVKHFPGPMGAPTEANGAAGPEPRWDPASLEPYRELVQGGNADIVMIGHAVHAEFSDAPGLPASLSEKAIQTRLRGEIGFSGVIISDDLEAKAVAARFPLEESVVRALKAGNDMLLIGNRDQPSPGLPDRVAAIIKRAVATGALTRERLQASYNRIVAAKLGLEKTVRDIASAKQSEGGEDKPGAP